MEFMTAIDFSILMSWTVRIIFAFYRFLLFTAFAQRVADCSAPCIWESVWISTFSASFLSPFSFSSLPPYLIPSLSHLSPFLCFHFFPPH